MGAERPSALGRAAETVNDVTAIVRPLYALIAIAAAATASHLKLAYDIQALQQYGSTSYRAFAEEQRRINAEQIAAIREVQTTTVLLNERLRAVTEDQARIESEISELRRERGR